MNGNNTTFNQQNYSTQPRILQETVSNQHYKKAPPSPQLSQKTSQLSLSSGSMLHSAGGRSSNSGHQRRTNYPDDISTQQRIPSSQSAFNNSGSLLSFQNQERYQSYTNHRRQVDYQNIQPVLVASASAINSNMNVPQRI